MAKSFTAADVARWMIEELNQKERLYQETVVYEIRKEFGEEFTYMNASGGLAIDKKVLAAFRKLSGDSVIWERGERMWRGREDYDDPDRRQQD